MQCATSTGHFAPSCDISAGALLSTSTLKWLLGLAAALALYAPQVASAQCVDEALKEQLIGRRAYRGVVPRVFRKALRHEISALGGWYAADLSDGAPAFGGAYTFHATEELGLEISYLRTRRVYGFLDAINARGMNLTQVTSSTSTPVQLFMGNWIWSIAYGKVRWFGGAIGRFDFHVALGGGATDEDGSTSLTGSGGFGMKMHLTQWSVFRLDVRDQVHRQAAPLGVEKIVNDVSILGGLSLFIPFSP
jgi:outer membrane beta-barrel protein